MTTFRTTVDITFPDEVIDELGLDINTELPADLLEAITNASVRGKGHIWLGADGRDMIFSDDYNEIRNVTDFGVTKIPFIFSNLGSE